MKKRAKAESVEKMVLGRLDTHRQKKKKSLNTDLTPFTKINSKCIIYLNVKHKNMKLLDNNVRVKLDNLEFGNDVLDFSPKE